MATARLCAHSDKDVRMMTIEELRALPKPPRTRSYVPVAHAALADLTREHLAKAGLRVRSEEHAVTREGDRYFGVMELDRGAGVAGVADDWSMVCGMRNSHDRRIAAGFAVGSRVFVCDNLAFTGEVQFRRRHVGYIEHELPVMVAESVIEWIRASTVQTDRFLRWKVTDARKRHDTLIVRALVADAIKAKWVLPIVTELSTPRYDQFRDGSAWSAFNCFTTVMRDAVKAGDIRFHDLEGRTRLLTNAFDCVLKN